MEITSIFGWPYTIFYCCCCNGRCVDSEHFSLLVCLWDWLVGSEIQSAESALHDHGYQGKPNTHTHINNVSSICGRTGQFTGYFWLAIRFQALSIIKRNFSDHIHWLDRLENRWWRIIRYLCDIMATFRRLYVPELNNSEMEIRWWSGRLLFFIVEQYAWCTRHSTRQSINNFLDNIGCVRAAWA